MQQKKDLDFFCVLSPSGGITTEQQQMSEYLYFLIPLVFVEQFGVF